MIVYSRGKQIKPDPKKLLGQGGEAEVFELPSSFGPGLAVKIFKPPNHPDFKDNSQERRGAEIRIMEHQKKLPAFPKELPPQVVVPIDLVTDQKGDKILGYTMKIVLNCEVLLKYADIGFRQAGVQNKEVIDIFKDLHTAVSGIHRKGVVLGDFNDLNVLVAGNRVYIIDADSFQFGPFLCRVFTEKFVDPLLCDPKKTSPVLFKPYNPDSDWYAFAIMLMQCLLFVGPYGGVYKPKDNAKRINQGQRPLHHITIFDKEVKYPGPAIHFSVLPDDLLQLFYKMFQDDYRGEFPLAILDSLRWTKCIDCGSEHARGTCPVCKKVAPELVKEVTIVRGNVTATRIFQTKGIILHAAFQDKKLLWLYHENGEFKREDELVVTKGALNPSMRFRIKGADTLIAQGNTLITFVPGNPQPERIAVDCYQSLPVFDANENSKFWVDAGRLLTDGQFGGSEFIGDVLENQTLFWAGPKFGFGFYRAGELSMAFVFDTKNKGINDNVKLPRIKGQLVDSICVFTKYYCWFFITTQFGGKTINRCCVIRENGIVEAVAEAEEGDGSWLSNIRGKCAAGDFLLAATDNGIVKVSMKGGSIVKTGEFPDTEPFVDSGCYLYPGDGGIYVRRGRDIQFLQIR